MRNETMRDEDKLRNPLCIRWDDEGYQRLTDEAWRIRVSASELVRRLVEEGLRRLDAEGAQKAG